MQSFKTKNEITIFPYYVLWNPSVLKEAIMYSLKKFQGQRNVENTTSHLMFYESPRRQALQCIAYLILIS